MKTMFSMGFSPDLFGSRVTNPTLGRAPRKMGDTTVDGDALLKQLQVAEREVAAANSFAQAHPNLEQALGNDLGTWQNYMSIVSDGSVATAEANVMSQLSAPGAQVDLSSSDYAAVQSYIEAAGILSQIVARHQGPAKPIAKLSPPPSGAPAASSCVPSDLTVPLLVGGGVLAIGVIALLARA